MRKRWLNAAGLVVLLTCAAPLCAADTPEATAPAADPASVESPLDLTILLDQTSTPAPIPAAEIIQWQGVCSHSCSPCQFRSDCPEPYESCVEWCF